MTAGAARTRLRRTIAVVALAAACWALFAGLYAVDVTHDAVVTRFGRVVRVVNAPGLHLAAPFDRVTRLDKRLLFSVPARAEYLTEDKKNVVVQPLVTWRI